MPGIVVKEVVGNVRVSCPNCGRRHWVPETSASNKALLRCPRCTRTKICNKCGRQYKKSHVWCPAENKPSGLVVLDGEKRKLGPLRPKDRDRFSTVICLHDWNHFHLADTSTTGLIVARCDRRLVASHTLPAIAIDFWGMLAMDATESPSYAGPWCRRCLALANRLIGREAKFRVAREI
jgi:uncharacterized C2H2 Zn-finger protein